MHMKTSAIICIYHNELVIAVDQTTHNIWVDYWSIKKLTELGIPVAETPEDAGGYVAAYFADAYAKDGHQDDYEAMLKGHEAEQAFWSREAQVADMTPEDEQQMMDDIEADHWIGRHKSGEFDDLPF